MFHKNKPTRPEPVCEIDGKPSTYSAWEHALCEGCYSSWAVSDEVLGTAKRLEPYAAWQQTRAKGGPHALAIDPELAAKVRAWRPPTLDQRIAAYRAAAKAYVERRKLEAA